MFWVCDKKSHKIASWEKKLWPFLLSPFKSRFFSFFHLSEKLTEKNDNIKNKKKLCTSLWLIYKFSHHSIFWFLSYSPWRKIHKKSDKSVIYINIFMKSRVMNLCFTTHPHVFLSTKYSGMSRKKYFFDNYWIISPWFNTYQI